MNDDHLQAWIEPELEARLTALVLGEASDFEREELERLIGERPELGVYRQRMETIHELLRSNAKDEEKPESIDGDWKLSGNKRNALVETLGTAPGSVEGSETPHEAEVDASADEISQPDDVIRPPRGSFWKRAMPVTAAACLALLLTIIVAVSVPGTAPMMDIASYQLGEMSSAPAYEASRKGLADSREGARLLSWSESAESGENESADFESELSLREEVGRKDAEVRYDFDEAKSPRVATQPMKKESKVAQILAQTDSKTSGNIDQLLRESLVDASDLAEVEERESSAAQNGQVPAQREWIDASGMRGARVRIGGGFDAAQLEDQVITFGAGGDFVTGVAGGGGQAEGGEVDPRSLNRVVTGNHGAYTNPRPSSDRAGPGQQQHGGVVNIDNQVIARGQIKLPKAEDAQQAAGANEDVERLFAVVPRVVGGGSESGTRAVAPTSPEPSELRKKGNSPATKYPSVDDLVSVDSYGEAEPNPTSTQEVEDKVPMVGDLPEVGRLFKSSQEVAAKEESKQRELERNPGGGESEGESDVFYGGVAISFGPDMEVVDESPEPFALSMGASDKAMSEPAKPGAAGRIHLGASASDADMIASSTPVIATATAAAPAPVTAPAPFAKPAEPTSDSVKTVEADSAMIAGNLSVSSPSDGFAGQEITAYPKEVADSIDVSTASQSLAELQNTRQQLKEQLKTLEAARDSLPSGESREESLQKLRVTMEKQAELGKRLADTQASSVMGRMPEPVKLKPTSGVVPNQELNAKREQLAQNNQHLERRLIELTDGLENGGDENGIARDYYDRARNTTRAKMIQNITEQWDAQLTDVESSDESSDQRRAGDSLGIAQVDVDGEMDDREAINVSGISAAYDSDYVFQGEPLLQPQHLAVSSLDGIHSESKAPFDNKPAEGNHSSLTDTSASITPAPVGIAGTDEYGTTILGAVDGDTTTSNFSEDFAFVGHGGMRNNDTPIALGLDPEIVEFEGFINYGYSEPSSEVRGFGFENLRAEIPTALEELDAADENFSTFSLHVGDVSFKLAMASLAKGEWPDASGIRIEEFVNAMNYDDARPTQDERVACQIEQAVHPFLQQRNLLRVSMSTAALGRAAGTPLRLTFLLDNSGSMERIDRQETVRRAFAQLAGQLQPNDQVTLISFARQPRLLADQVSGDQANQLVDTVSTLPSEGGTNLEAALQLAFEKAAEQQDEGAQNRIVLLTDGAANLGDAQPESLSAMIETMRDSGIAFDAAGIGADGLNDEILEALTRKGDGRYYLLDRPEDADDGFARQIAGALRPAAMNVKVQIEFNPDRVGKYKLLGFEKHRLEKEDFRDDSVDAAEMAAEEAGVAVYQFEAKPDGEGDIGFASVRFRDMSSGEMVEKRWPILYEPSAPRPDQAAPSMKIATAASQFAAHLRGDPAGAVVELNYLTSLLADLPPRHAENEHVQQLRTMIDQARQISGQ